MADHILRMEDYEGGLWGVTDSMSDQRLLHADLLFCKVYGQGYDRARASTELDTFWARDGRANHSTTTAPPFSLSDDKGTRLQTTI